MSRIYIIEEHPQKGPGTGSTAFVRAKTVAGALRAHIRARFSVEAASTDDIVEANRAGALDILDALDDGADPGPVPGGVA